MTDHDNVVTSSSSSGNNNDVATSMAFIFGTMLALLISLVLLQTPASNINSNSNIHNNHNHNHNHGSRFLPCPMREPSKYQYEWYVWRYTPIWIGAFAVIIAFQLYESFDAWTYDLVCGGLAVPLLLQPVALYYNNTNNNGTTDTTALFQSSYAFKANLWLAVFSFIGNYWYTHYFYSVLQASYTMPAHRLNNVPIAMYFATHFYFSTYHALSNALLRKVHTSYRPGTPRLWLHVGVVTVLAYFTAFMETLTISNFPYYDFADRNMAYTVGSAFYGIYFLVSFPMFYDFDRYVDDDSTHHKIMTTWDTIVHSCGCGMLVLIWLDFVRLLVGVPLVVGA